MKNTYLACLRQEKEIKERGVRWPVSNLRGDYVQILLSGLLPVFEDEQAKSGNELMQTINICLAGGWKEMSHRFKLHGYASLSY